MVILNYISNIPVNLTSVTEQVIELPVYFIIASKHQTRVSLKNRRRKTIENNHADITTFLVLRNLSEPVTTRNNFNNLGTFTIRREFIISILSEV